MSSYQNQVKPDYTTLKHQKMRPSKRRKINAEGKFDCRNTIINKCIPLHWTVESKTCEKDYDYCGINPETGDLLLTN